MFKNPKVFQKNTDKEIVRNNKTQKYTFKLKQDSKIYRKGLDMRIENEMLSRFKQEETNMVTGEISLSQELDFFFDNVLDTVVDYFKEEQLV